MTKPLGLCLYENLMPGSQLANRLQDLGYRVQVIGDARQLLSEATTEKPMLVLVDLACQRTDICRVIKELRQSPATSHIPVLAFTNHSNTALQAAAREAGATLVAAEEAILVQLPQLLDQVLEVE